MKKYLVHYCNQRAIVSTKEEAVMAIESFHSYGNKSNPTLIVNEYVGKVLADVFSDEPKGYVENSQWNSYKRSSYSLHDIRTTNCGAKSLSFYPALGDTVEEHEAAYRSRVEAEKAERLRLAEEAKQRLLAEYSEIRRGWYYVEVEIEAHDMYSMRRKYLVSSGYAIANSKMDAYNKFVSDRYAFQDQCANRNAHFFSCSAWNSSDTQIYFLGIKTDEGYSLAAWEEFSKTDEYKESVK